MTNKLFRTRICAGTDSKLKDGVITGYRIDNVRARATLASLLEALRADPNASLYIDVWISEPGTSYQYDINASVGW